jgi:hypothetical protein
MTGMENIERELAAMKSDTLCRLGRRVEIAVEMLEGEEVYCKRLKGMILRVRKKLDGRLKWRRRRIYTRVLERVERKFEDSGHRIIHIREAKEKAVADYKLQREILGLNDHTFVDGYLREHGQL